MLIKLKSKIPYIIAIIQWYITSLIQVDELFFEFGNGMRNYAIIQVLYLIFLLVVWGFIFNVINKIKSGNEVWKRGVFLFSVYVIFTMVLLLILWPGTWSWDDICTLNAIYTYESFCAWQNVLTGIYQDVLLQILPFPGGLIILQNILISICVAFTVTKLEITFNICKINNTVLDTILKLLPFIAPPVLMYQFSGYRVGIYIYLELVMVVMLVCAWKDKEKWSINYILLFSFLCVISAVWRTESLFYIPCVVLLLLFVNKKVIPNKEKIISISILIVGYLALSNFQKSELGNSNYKIVSILRPCVELVRIADPVEDAKELEMIDKVANLKIVFDNPSMNGDQLYWNSPLVRNKNDDPTDDYSLEDYENFFNSFIKLSLKYPDVVISDKLKVFITGSGVTGECTTNIPMTVSLFEPDNNNSAAQDAFAIGWIGFKPISKKLRNGFINLLGFRIFSGNVNELFKRIVWNALIPELVLVGVFIKMLIKKQWYYFGICTTILIKLAVIVLTQPSSWIMYVMSFYMMGYVLLIYGMFSKMNH